MSPGRAPPPLRAGGALARVAGPGLTSWSEGGRRGGGRLGRERGSAAREGAALLARSRPPASAMSLSRQVQGTGGSSAVSKCSAAARGYIQDRFLPLLAGRRRRRAPLVHR